VCCDEMFELKIFSSLLGWYSFWGIYELDRALAGISVKFHVVDVGAALCPVQAGVSPSRPFGRACDVI
jgi:hypothetical protein